MKVEEAGERLQRLNEKMIVLLKEDNVSDKIIALSRRVLAVTDKYNLVVNSDNLQNHRSN